MPYFKWTGIDIVGKIYRGKDFARSKSQIDSVLFLHNVSLINIKQVSASVLAEKVSSTHKLEFFRMLSILLGAGVKLHEALEIILAKQKNGRFKLVIEDIKDAVGQGINFGEALAYHNDIFDSLTCALIISGTESGNLSQSLNIIVESAQERQIFLQNLRSALLMPIITFGFFLVILILLFIFVIPRFVDMFNSFGNQIPWATKLVINISNTITSFNFFYVLLAMLFFVFIFNKVFKIELVKKIKDDFLLKTPIFGQIILQFNVANFLHTLSVLLQGGVHVVKALEISRQAVSNLNLSIKINQVSTLVESGKNLSDALKQVGFDDPELIALVAVGQESGALSFTILKAAQIYQDRFYRRIKFLITLIQPLLLIVIGLFIATLIFAVYVPIFTMSSVIQ